MQVGWRKGKRFENKKRALRGNEQKIPRIARPRMHESLPLSLDIFKTI
jgi:hypothetical protein